jgi:hypothetical protein
MRARYYNPDIKRFINQDVLLGNINNDQSLNRYAYCNGQPVSNTDPFGLCPDSDNQHYQSNQIDIVGYGSVYAANAGVNSGGSSLFIETPYGLAEQSTLPECQAVAQSVQNGAILYKAGVLGRSYTSDSQFWSTESPLSPGYAESLGIPPENSNFDFVMSGTLKPGTPFVTRPAPPSPGNGLNGGGTPEVVVSKGGVDIDSFSMPDATLPDMTIPEPFFFDIL